MLRKVMLDNCCHALARLIALVLALVLPPAVSQAGGLQIRTSVDHFIKTKTPYKGNVGTSVLYRFDNGFFFGGTVYSAAFGDAGGLFIGGVEVGKQFRLGGGNFAEAAVFYGGGGGAGQVPGDGSLLRPRFMLGHDFDGLQLAAGVSYVRVTGSKISTPALELAFTAPFNLLSGFGHVDSCSSCDDMMGKLHVSLKEVKAVAKSFRPLNDGSRTAGKKLSPMFLAGTEFVFDFTQKFDIFFSAAGAAHGDGAGYAEWLAGLRYIHPIGPVDLFADAGLGFAGGGDVNTGGGFIGAANAGIEAHLTDWISLTASLGLTGAMNGKFLALVPAISIAAPLGGTAKDRGDTPLNPTKWRVSGGYSVIPSHKGMRKPGTGGSKSLGLINTKFDLMFSPRFYLSGQAYTITYGDAGGFAMGLVGPGYTIPVGDRFAISAEVLAGAAAGGGINTGGGAVGVVNLDLDYKLSSSVALGLDLGWIHSWRGGLDAPLIGLGLKVDFTTFQ